MPPELCIQEQLTRGTRSIGLGLVWSSYLTRVQFNYSDLPTDESSFRSGLCVKGVQQEKEQCACAASEKVAFGSNETRVIGAASCFGRFAKSEANAAGFTCGDQTRICSASLSKQVRFTSITHPCQARLSLLGYHLLAPFHLQPYLPYRSILPFYLLSSFPLLNNSLLFFQQSRGDRHVAHTVTAQQERLLSALVT